PGAGRRAVRFRPRRRRRQVLRGRGHWGPQAAVTVPARLRSIAATFIISPDLVLTRFARAGSLCAYEHRGRGHDTADAVQSGYVSEDGRRGPRRPRRSSGTGIARASPRRRGVAHGVHHARLRTLRHRVTNTGRSTPRPVSG